MSEITEIWHALRCHLGLFGHFNRIESPAESGIPDVAYTVLGCSGWIENKLFSVEGRAPPHLTLSQVIWGETQVKAGGRWFLLGKCRNVWLLYNSVGARVLLERGNACPMFRVMGFPKKELLDIIAPPELRRRG